MLRKLALRIIGRDFDFIPCGFKGTQAGVAVRAFPWQHAQAREVALQVLAARLSR